MGRISITDVTRWVRHKEPARSVDPARFQGDAEPYPGHWSEFPVPWPPVDPDDPAVAEVLVEAVGELPATWRSVVVARDERGEDAAEIAARYAVTEPRQRAILNKARASLLRRLADYFDGTASRERG